MKGQKKQIKYLLLFSILLGICFPNTIFAEEGEQKEKGKMEIKTDRITKYREQLNEVFKETELEKTMPHLFDESTQEKIHEKQDTSTEKTKELKHTVLVEKIEEDGFIEDVQNALFTDDYEVAFDSVDEDQKSKSEMISTNIIIASLVLFGALVCVGIYFFIQRWNAS